MKKIKVGDEVLMIGYRLDELAPAEKRYAIEYELMDRDFIDWTISDFIDHANANEYLFTKAGIMIPLTHIVAPSGKVIAHKIKVAEVKINVTLEEVEE